MILNVHINTIHIINRYSKTINNKNYMPNFDDNMQWEFNGGTLPNNSQMSHNHLKSFDHVLAMYKELKE